MDCIVDDNQDRVDLMSGNFRLLDDDVPTDEILTQEKKHKWWILLSSQIDWDIWRYDFFYKDSISCKANFGVLLKENILSNVIKFDTSNLVIKRWYHSV